MRYRITHVTKYAYEEQASVCHNKVHLRPRPMPGQNTRSFHLHVSPEPAAIVERTDYFGNGVHYFTVQDPHRVLSVTGASEIDVDSPTQVVDFNSSPPWEAVVEQLRRPGDDAQVAAAQFTFPSSYTPVDDEFADYARPSFPAGRQVLAGASDLTRRIFSEFKYVPQATSLSTPVHEVLARRVGVCQDFAHLQIACLRSMGLAARYVSGYLRTMPPPGKARLVGADASHAWLSVWDGIGSWVDFDPTNNVVPGADHITVAFGRDYGDVCPIQGVFVGGGGHRMTVSVDVEAVDAASPA
ncbi:MAG: transglutaminase family protein [Planctomycetales bacterium]|nr:transglutaminase family protein [Planctomycetales bacterium]